MALLSTPRKQRQVDPGQEPTIEEQLRQLEANIEELRSLPDKLRREREDKENTIPPPDDALERTRRRSLEERMSRGVIANERRAQGKSFMLLILLTATTGALLFWIWQVMQNATL